MGVTHGQETLPETCRGAGRLGQGVRWPSKICTVSRGKVKINITCHMIKLDFWRWPPLKNASRVPGNLHRSTWLKLCRLIGRLCLKESAYQKRAPNRAVFYLLQVSDTSHLFYIGPVCLFLFVLCLWSIFSCLFWVVSTSAVIAWKDSSPKWPVIYIFISPNGSKKTIK